MAKLLPKEKLVPQKDLAELAFKEKKKQEQVTIFHTGFSQTKMRLSHLVNILLFLRCTFFDTIVQGIYICKIM
jgi:hypothetical protein